MLKSKVMVATVFIAGCLVGGISSHLVFPPAQAGSSPAGWDYNCIEVLSGADTSA
jgi:hypothetical protein